MPFPKASHNVCRLKATKTITLIWEDIDQCTQRIFIPQSRSLWIIFATRSSQHYLPRIFSRENIHFAVAMEETLLHNHAYSIHSPSYGYSLSLFAAPWVSLVCTTVICYEMNWVKKDFTWFTYSFWLGTMCPDLCISTTALSGVNMDASCLLSCIPTCLSHPSSSPNTCRDGHFKGREVVSISSWCSCAGETKPEQRIANWNLNIFSCFKHDSRSRQRENATAAPWENPSTPSKGPLSENTCWSLFKEAIQPSLCFLYWSLSKPAIVCNVGDACAITSDSEEDIILGVTNHAYFWLGILSIGFNCVIVSPVSATLNTKGTSWGASIKTNSAMDFSFFVKDANLPFRLDALCRNPCKQRILSPLAPVPADPQMHSKREKIKVIHRNHQSTDEKTHHWWLVLVEWSFPLCRNKNPSDHCSCHSSRFDWFDKVHIDIIGSQV